LLEGTLAGAGAGGEPLSNLADLPKAGVGAHRLAALAADLEPVVVRRVMAGRGLHAAGRSQVVYREVDLRRVDHPDVNDLHARGTGTVHERRLQFGAALAHVTAHRDGGRGALGMFGAPELAAEKLSGRRTDPPGHLRIERVGKRSPHVVRLEHLLKHVCFVPVSLHGPAGRRRAGSLLVVVELASLALGEVGAAPPPTDSVRELRLLLTRTVSIIGRQRLHRFALPAPRKGGELC